RGGGLALALLFGAQSRHPPMPIPPSGKSSFRLQLWAKVDMAGDNSYNPTLGLFLFPTLEKLLRTCQHHIVTIPRSGSIASFDSLSHNHSRRSCFTQEARHQGKRKAPSARHPRALPLPLRGNIVGPVWI